MPKYKFYYNDPVVINSLGSAVSREAIEEGLEAFMEKERESEIERYLVDRVKRLKGEERKVKWINRRGAPDRMIWIPGWQWPKMPEMKAPGKPLEPHQIREHKRLKKMGIKCCKLDSKQDVDRFLRART